MDLLKNIANKKKDDLLKLVANAQAKNTVLDTIKPDNIKIINESENTSKQDEIISDLLAKREDGPNEIEDETFQHKIKAYKTNNEAENIEISLEHKLNKEFKDETDELETLKQIIINDLKSKLPDNKDMEPKQYIKEWNYKLTQEEKYIFEAHNKIFSENFKASLSYYKKFDYHKTASYHERCDDIYYFIVETVNAYTNDLYERSQNTEVAKMYTFKRELETLRSIKTDIQFLILYLKEYVC